MSSGLHTVFFVSLATFELGPQGRILRLAKGWQARGYSTAIAALQGDGVIGERERALGVPIHVLTKHDKRILRAGRLDAMHAVRGFVAREKPQLVFALETLVDWHVKLGLLGRDEPIVTLLGIDRWKWERKFYRRALFRALAPRTSALIGNSTRCLDGYRRALGARAVDPIPKAVVPNPVDAEEFAPVFERRHDELVIGAIGRLAEQKGFDLLLRAAATLPATLGGRKLRVRIQGSGPDESALRELAREVERNGIAVEFLSHGSDVRSFYHSLDGLVVPSRWSGFENTALEGILCGTPTIVSRATGFEDLADRDAFLFCELEPASIRATLLELLSRTGVERAAVARRQRAALIAELSLDTIAGRLERALADLGVLAPNAMR
ncbi:MAG: glycosyltransferase family 4 protein [Planctomycetes bacterium]|nr:glycosyltransferase family 4 protein [Planctomycetota bacterium]